MKSNNDINYVREEDKFIGMLNRDKHEFLNYEKIQFINNAGAEIGSQFNIEGYTTFDHYRGMFVPIETKERVKITYLDKEYSTIMENILKTGFEYEDPNRKGVTRKQIPFATISASGRGVFEDGVISIRKSYFKGAVNELLLFLKGETDVREYEKNGVKFWSKDQHNFRKRVIGDISLEEYIERNGGVSLTPHQLEKLTKNYYSLGEIYPYHYKESYYVFDNFKQNPYRTDLIVNSWQRESLDPKTSSLNACHFAYQFVKTRDGFGIVWMQRSTDILLGTSLNLTFYWLMGKILEIWSGHKFDFVRGELHNVHLYDNQFELADKIIEVGRNSDTDHSEHKVEIDSSTWGLDLPFEEFIKTVKPEHFKLKNYKPIINETVEMLAYDE